MSYAFGDFTLDTDAYELRRGSETLPIEPKVFDVLRFLIEHRERVVHKEELLEALWPGEFVTDSVLPRCIATARKALGDDRSRQNWIQTAHGRGYRFVGELREREKPNAEAGAESAGFVGRVPELERLETLTDQALDGKGRLILIAGEPGIGKTRIADEVVRRASARGALRLEGRCFEGSGAPPFWPWVQTFRGWHESVGDGGVERALAGRSSELAPLLPALSENEGASVPVDPGASRFQLFDAIALALRQSARERPIALVLDDLHYADEPSLDLLRFVARDLHRWSVLVVATYRDVELRRTHPLATLLGTLASEPCHERLALRGLGIPEVAEVLAEQAPAADSASLAETVHDLSGGNPFFVGQIASLLRDGETRTLADRLPEGVKEAVGRRLDFLAQSTVEVMRSAAVIGREFSLHVLARVVELPREGLLAAIDEALHYRLIESRDRSAGRYAFAHALVGQTLYEELPTPLRVRLHERVAEAMELQYGDGDEAPLDEIAHHYFEAASSGRAHRAVHFMRRAAERAATLFAFEESAAKYEQALAAQALALDEPADSTLRCELLLAKGDQESRAGRRGRARETFVQALQRAREEKNPQLFGRAALGFGGRGEMGLGGDPRTGEFIEEALEELGDGDRALRAKLLARLCGAPPHTYSMKRRRALSEECWALARETDDAGAMTQALAARSWALLGPDHIEERLEVSRELLELARRPGGRATGFLGYDPLFLAYEYRYLSHLAVADLRASDQDLRELDRLAHELRQPIYHWFVSFLRTSRAISAGRYDEAIALLGEASSDDREPVHPTAEFIRRGQELWIASQIGDYATVRAGVQLLYESSLTLKQFAKTAEAMLRVVTDQREEGRRCYEAVASEGFRSLEHDEAYLVQLGFLAGLALEFDDRERSAELLELLRPYVHLNATIDLLRISDGRVASYAAQAATGAGDWEQAERYFQQALDFDQETGGSADSGSIRYHWAEMLARRGAAGDRERCLELLGKAEALLAPVGHARRLRDVGVLRAKLL